MEHKCNKSDVKAIEKCELNLKQVIKALEWCSSGGNCIKCAENVKNPRLSKEGCMSVQMRNALDLINELTEENESLRAKGEWISVDDRLPECEWGAESEAVLFITKMETMYTGYYGCGGIYRDRYFREYKNSTEGYDISFITHWMPLPEPPKMKGE